ncbi:MAG: sulfatase-like hydrolase/transferase [Chloroflexi bacterium]|nr:sulfatase-like hydrolase/transferase [Chloroflexota bacterium]
MSQPNIIIFMTDDQGYGDLSCMGNTDFRTPHLDRLAASGARFTNWYSNSPVCSPSRAALLTGRYPGHAGVRAILAGHRTATGLPARVPSLATALKRQGYRTALFGKWHLGLAEGSRPTDHGFDETFGFMAGCVDYYSHIFYWGMNTGWPGMNPTHDLWRNNRETWEYNGRYLTELITEKTVDYIRGAAQQSQPFFAYVAYNAPYYPMHAPPKYMQRFADLSWDRQIMAAMISAVDDGVGEIVAELERRNIRDDTLIFFMSDNGPSRESRNWLDGRSDPYYGGSTGWLKGHKFSLFEGGIRVPALMSWPARIPPVQVIDAPLAAMDIFPTCLQAAGGAAADYALDGLDIMPVVADGRAAPERDLFWEMDAQTAMRRGPWKLVLNGQLVEGEPPADPLWLSNLADDTGEHANLSAAHPRVTAELAAAARAWREMLEQRWQADWGPHVSGMTGKDSSANRAER